MSSNDLQNILALQRAFISFSRKASCWRNLTKSFLFQVKTVKETRAEKTARNGNST